MPEARAMLAAYFRQQAELGMPDYIFSAGFKPGSSRPAPAMPEQTRVAARNAPAVNAVPPSVNEPAAAYGAASHSTTREKLKALYIETRACNRCGLSASRQTYVFGAGNANAPLMVVGEAPGAEEDRQGLPFVGAAGQLLTKMLAAIHLDRSRDVFITNVLKCRPPQNRDPDSGEAKACMEILRAQIEIMGPRAILALGRVAAGAILDTNKGVGELRGAPHEFRGVPVVVTYHPAALLRNEQLKRPAWDDLKKLEHLLQSLNAYAADNRR
jgi:DNA polymerase